MGHDKLHQFDNDPLYPYIIDIKNKDNLLVCIGDSWTWGDSITENLRTYPQYIERGFWTGKDYDKAERAKLVYGYHLSQMLDTDWYNIAFPGMSNWWMVEQLKQLLNHQSMTIDNYKNIYFIITLTETGRELNSTHNLINSTHRSCDEVLRFMEDHCVKNIINLYTDRFGNNLDNLIIARNFTVSYDTTKYHTDHLMNWVEINAKHEGLEKRAKLKRTGPLTKMAIDPTIQHCKKLDHKRYIVNQLNYMEPVMNYLHKSVYHYKWASKHPNAESHKFWADYLYKQLKLRNI